MGHVAASARAPLGRRLTAAATAWGTLACPAVALVGGGLVTGVGLGLVAAAPAEASPATTYARKATTWTNKRRVSRNRAELSVDACLRARARQQASRMADERRLFHSDLRAIADDCGLAAVGENVASGYPTGVAVVNQGWMRSAPHRRNLLSRGFRVVGIAAARDDDGEWWVAQVLGRKD